ncbi:GT-D fold domain-containing glycosyltransferase [Flavobacteriaceae bacterium]|nr:GT-D fold domain-containing glycosyltransferase [Flavobacteriaceae bacterium]
MQFFKRRVKLLTKIETLELIVNENISVSRFGDGELILALEERDIPFQGYSQKIRDKLLSILKNTDPNILICYNNNFSNSKKYFVVKKYERSKKKYIKSITVKLENDIGILFREDEQVFYKQNLKYIKSHSKLKILGEATVFFLDRYFKEYKSDKIKYVQRLYTELFRDKNILIVSPKSPLLAPSFQFLVEKKIIKSFKSCSFIEINPKNAFSHFDHTLETLQSKILNVDVVIIQGGAFATILSYEITKLYQKQALDVGSLNISLYNSWLRDGVSF